MLERVQALKDLSVEGGGIIPQGTVGILMGKFPLATGGKVATVDWEQDDGAGPGIRLNVYDGEYQILP